MEIFTLVHLSWKLKLIWWISLSLDFRRNWWKNIFSWQFHILQCKVSFYLGHNWTSYKFSKLKHDNYWNVRTHKIFVDFFLIFLCIFGYITNFSRQTHWNVENLNNSYRIFGNLITKCNRLSERLPPKSILEMICSFRY